MPKMWRNCIERRTKTFNECPERYKNDVLALMRQDVVDGIITAEQFEELTGIPYVEPNVEE